MWQKFVDKGIYYMINVAIDGPAGAGKSTVSRAVAKKLGFIYVDTGALYRSITLNVVRNNAIGDVEKIVKLLDSTDVKLTFDEKGEQRVILNGEDVSSLIRTPEISINTATVSQIPEVREFLLGLQRKIAAENNVIMDGRDIGSVVLPNADKKIFLTASAECRAKRRYDELVAKGENVTYEDVLSDVNKRDYEDSHREIAPMKPTEESIIADNTGMTVDESAEMVVKIINGDD